MPKSAFASPGMRASALRHLESMRIDRVLFRPNSVTVVDDFITKGATALAAASLVKDAFPEAQVRVFALVRTMGLVPNVDRCVEPCVGRISLQGTDAWREP